MNSDIVATPFGRRGLSLGRLASQFASKTVGRDLSIDKWKIFRATCEARPLLGVSDRSLAVLNALISFYPKAELSEEHGLVVFPSNQQLSLRAHGMPEQTLRRHLAALVDAGLILRKDSPNGKRYARKDRRGDISDAFGFSLAPLITRADEICAMAEQLIEERLQMQRLREKISLCRRDIVKFAEVALEENAEGDWNLFQSRYFTIKSTLDRKCKAPHLALILDELTILREEMANSLEKHIEIQKISGNAYQNERLIQSSESESIFETQDVDKSVPNDDKVLLNEADRRVKTQVDSKTAQRLPSSGSDSFDLQTVIQACPEISLYGPNGTIRSWEDLQQAGNVVKNMLSISQSAYERAESAMGKKSTLAIIACILEKIDVIQSPGGYLRSLTEKAITRQFSIKPMLTALLRTQLSSKLAANLQ